jgi:hypothetical protein
MREEEAQEELSFIYQVMQEAQHSLHSLHRVLLFFGAFALLGSAGSYLLAWLYPPVSTSGWIWFWLVYWLGPVVMFIAYELRWQRWHWPSSWGEKLLWVLWSSCLGGAVLSAWVLPILVVKVRAAWGLPVEQYALLSWDEFVKWVPVAVLFGAALLLTGFIYRVKGLSLAGIGCGLTALGLALVPPSWVQGVAGVGLGLSFLYAGWRLKRARADQEWTEALRRFKELVASETGDDPGF